MTIEEIKEKALDLIVRKKYVSFVELRREFKDTFDGDCNMWATVNPNVIFWSGMSMDMINVLSQLIAEKKIHMLPAELLTYLIDGAQLTLPVVTAPKLYDTPHWCPVTFNPGPINHEILKEHMSGRTLSDMASMKGIEFITL